MMELSPEQCRAARALLNWPQIELGRKSEVDKKTIADFERGARIPHKRTLAALVATLEEAGVVFFSATEKVRNIVGMRIDDESPVTNEET